MRTFNTVGSVCTEYEKGMNFANIEHSRKCMHEGYTKTLNTVGSVCNKDIQREVVYDIMLSRCKWSSTKYDAVSEV